MYIGTYLSHTLLSYLAFCMLYQRGADFCLPSLRIRSMPFLGASSDLVTLQHYSVRFDIHLWSWYFPQTLFPHLSILCIICYRQRESIVTCEIVVIPMNSRSIELTCIKSLLLFNHCIIVTFDFFSICELSFNRDFAHCWRVFDVSNKYYLLTYLLQGLCRFRIWGRPQACGVYR